MGTRRKSAHLERRCGTPECGRIATIRLTLERLTMFADAPEPMAVLFCDRCTEALVGSSLLDAGHTLLWTTAMGKTARRDR